MERIKQALERARDERRHNAGAGMYPLRRTGLPTPDKLLIRYTQTRSFSVTQERMRDHRLVCGLDGSIVADAYRILRTRVIQRMRANGWTSLAVTSLGENNGKTLTAINLAISMALEVNHTVLLADFDLRRPSIVHYFTDEALAGVSDYLLRGTPVSELLFNPGIERLVVLPGNEPIANSSEILSSPAMVNLVRDLKTRYESRFLIYDMPILCGTDDVMAFSPHIDAVLLVVEDGQTLRDDLAQVPELLHGVKLIGTVLNKSTESLSGYY